MKWRTKSGKVLEISEMSTAHLINAVHFVLTPDFDPSYRDLKICNSRPLLFELFKRLETNPMGEYRSVVAEPSSNTPLVFVLKWMQIHHPHIYEGLLMHDPTLALESVGIEKPDVESCIRLLTHKKMGYATSDKASTHQQWLVMKSFIALEVEQSETSPSALFYLRLWEHLMCTQWGIYQEVLPSSPLLHEQDRVLYIQFPAAMHILNSDETHPWDLIWRHIGPLYPSLSNVYIRTGKEPQLGQLTQALCAMIREIYMTKKEVA